MLLENLTESQLDEVFNAEEIGTVYPVIDLTPKAKVPQMLHMKVPGTNDLIVRLTHLDTVGTRVKAVMPGDKTVQVFLMSLSEKGNITDFRGGLGSDPVGAINTIFTTVFEIAKKYRFEAVLFRFVKTSMKGQSQAVSRILTRLINQRSGGRFNALEEVTRAESGKFNFVMAVKKNSDILDDVQPEPEFKKVETVAGDTFVNTETGKQASKAEVVADAIVKKAAKVPAKTVISKTKISKQALMSALYGPTMNAETFKPAVLEHWKNLTANTPVIATTKETPENAMSNNDLGVLVSSTSGRMSFNHRIMSRNTIENVLENPGGWGTAQEIMEEMGVPPEAIGSFIITMNAQMAEILQLSSAKKPLSYQDSLEKIAKAALQNPHFAKLEIADRLEILDESLTLIRTIQDSVYQKFTDAIPVKNWSITQRKALKNYADEAFKQVNLFLLGEYSPPNLGPTINIINEMDSIFSEHGFRLPKWVKLYRGQVLNIPDAIMAVEKKMFYFRNFVSCSMNPIIYDETQFNKMGNSAATFEPNAMTSDDVDAETLVKSAGINRDYVSNTLRGGNTVQVSYVISGADKIKVIGPGELATYKEECEIILPRGTVFKFNKITGADEENAGGTSKDDIFNSLLIEAEVADPKLLTEDVVYDGDIFMESGELVPMYFDQEPQAQEVTDKPSFSDMFDNQYKPNTEVDKMLSAYAAACFDSMSDRFK